MDAPAGLTVTRTVYSTPHMAMLAALALYSILGTFKVNVTYQLLKIQGVETMTSSGTEHRLSYLQQQSSDMRSTVPGQPLVHFNYTQNKLSKRVR